MLQPAWQTTQMSNKFDVLHSEQAGKPKVFHLEYEKRGFGMRIDLNLDRADFGKKSRLQRGITWGQALNDAGDANSVLLFDCQFRALRTTPSKLYQSHPKHYPYPSVHTVIWRKGRRVRRKTWNCDVCGNRLVIFGEGETLQPEEHCLISLIDSE